MSVYELEQPVTSRETYLRCLTYLNAVNAEIETQFRLTWPSHTERLRTEGYCDMRIADLDFRSPMTRPLAQIARPPVSLIPPRRCPCGRRNGDLTVIRSCRPATFDYRIDIKRKTDTSFPFLMIIGGTIASPRVLASSKRRTRDGPRGCSGLWRGPMTGETGCVIWARGCRPATSEDCIDIAVENGIWHRAIRALRA